MSRKCREERGEVSLQLAVILIVGTLLFSAALSIHHVYAVIDRTIDKTNAAVLAVAASNVAQVYRGVRESDGTARTYLDEAWTHMVYTEAVEEALRISLDAVPSEGGITAGSFQILSLHTQYSNSDGDNLNFITTMRVEIPLSFGGGILPPLRLSLEVHTTYEPKFEPLPFPGTP